LSEPRAEAGASDMVAGGLRGDLALLLDRQAELRAKLERRRHRAVVAIPRLRAIGNLWLLLTVAAHNWLLLDHVDGSLLAGFGGLQLGYVLASQWLLARYYREESRVDLGTVFLAVDVLIFVLAIYVSGGEKSWLLPLLCVRVADQIATSPRRAFAFATWTALLHALLVLYMALVEQRGFRLDAELAKVLFIYVLNIYLALAAGPSERQRKEALRTTALAHELIDELGSRTQQLEIERARAESASRAKSTFLANISHEIRTPMNAVLGMADLLLDESLQPSQRKMAETIFIACRSLLAIVNDVLDMSKVEAGELKLQASDVDLKQMVETVLSPMRVLAESKGLRLSAELEGLSERAVRGDDMRLRQVLFNLVGNAIKFTHAGAVTMHVDQTELDAECVRVRFSVEDTGIGMTAEASKGVFEPFKQADESTTRKFGGTGLGLSISRHLVEMMGGVLTVLTAPERGSVFTFELVMPLGSLPRKEASVQGVSQQAERLRAAAPDVLIAEDTEVNRILLQKWLERLGCRVTSVGDGAQALAALTRDHPFAVVFMDWHMPMLDGLKATERIRQWEMDNARPRTPIIGFTASAFVDEIERCRVAGMDDVLSKPLVRSELEQKLYRHVLGAETPSERRSIPSDQAEPSVDPALIRELLEFGAKDFLHDLLGNFIKETPERLTALSQAVERRDSDSQREIAHTLRGSAGAVGAKRLSRLASNLEGGAAVRQTGDMVAALSAMRSEFEQVAAELGAVLARATSGPP
jgi:signal transduction histidine kinase/CheY-like chemotaxis protein/HPt (histidine-containing phosphotransfer) domain-containing protein